MREPDEANAGMSTEVHENLVMAMDTAATKACFDVIEAVAERLGVTEVHGVSLASFYSTARIERTDQNIAEIADDDPQLASRIKARWDELCAKHCRPLSEHSRARARGAI